jgi:hypothetical protein
MSHPDVTVPSLLDHAGRALAATDRQRQAMRELAAELAAARPPMPSPATTGARPSAASTAPSGGHSAPAPSGG